MVSAGTWQSDTTFFVVWPRKHPWVLFSPSSRHISLPLTLPGGSQQSLADFPPAQPLPQQGSAIHFGSHFLPFCHYLSPQPSSTPSQLPRDPRQPRAGLTNLSVSGVLYGN